MTAATIKQTRITILLSINAAAILIAGILIASAIWGGDIEFRAVSERSLIPPAARPYLEPTAQFIKLPPTDGSPQIQ